MQVEVHRDSARQSGSGSSGGPGGGGNLLLASARSAPYPGRTVSSLSQKRRSENDSARGTGRSGLRRGPVGFSADQVLPPDGADSPMAAVTAAAARLVPKPDWLHGRQA